MLVFDIKGATELAVALLCKGWSYCGKRGLTIHADFHFWSAVYIAGEDELVTFDFVRNARTGLTTCRVDGLPETFRVN